MADSVKSVTCLGHGEPTHYATAAVIVIIPPGGVNHAIAYSGYNKDRQIVVSMLVSLCISTLYAELGVCAIAGRVHKCRAAMLVGQLCWRPDGGCLHQHRPGALQGKPRSLIQTP